MEKLNTIGQRKVATRGALYLFALLAFASVSQAELKFEKTVIEDVIAPNANSYPFEFPFTNEGDSTVKISEVKTTCGCTTAKLEKMVYAPGESGVITGSFSVRDRKGLQQKSINVLMKDLGQPEIQLALKLEIPWLVKLKPRLLLWRLGDDPYDKYLTVSSDVARDIQILSVESESPDFKVEELNVAEGRGDLRVRVTPVDTQTQKRGLVKVEFSSDEFGSQVVDVYAVIR